MAFPGWAWLTLFMVPVVASGCPPQSADLKFQGTAFEAQPFQVEEQTIRFFAGTAREIAFFYRAEHKLWCYHSAHATVSRPQQGCLRHAQVKGKAVLMVNGKKMPVFALRDLKGQAVATVHVTGHLLTTNFLNGAGKTTGKRVVFSQTADGALDVYGWNCPNPRYLSCAGAHMQSAAVETSRSLASSPVHEVELSRLGHYSASCDGVKEITPIK